LGGAPQRTNVRDELIQLIGGQPADARHPAVGDAVADHFAQGLVGRGARQARTGQARTFVAGAVHPMTPRAHALKEFLTLLDIGSRSLGGTNGRCGRECGQREQQNAEKQSRQRHG